MGYQSLKTKPGINVEQSPLLNEAGYSQSVAVRFRDGMAEKIGGFSHLNSVPFLGIATGMHAWADLAGNPYIAAGTDQALDLFFSGLTYDITPLRATTNGSPGFTTQAGSNTVTITDSANGASVGDRVNILIPVSIGGLIIQGFYTVQTIVDDNDYTIAAASLAPNTAGPGGAVPLFTTIMGNTAVEVTLDNHGLVAGSVFNTQVSTTVGGITIAAGQYIVQTPVTTNSFFITPGATASSSTSGSENGGNAQIQYLIPTGLQSATYESSGGYGVGGYGVGPYGVTSGAPVLEPLRQWFLDNWGEDLVGNYTNSPIFVWTPPAEASNPAVPINTTTYPGAMNPPNQVVFSFVAGPQQMIIAGGCDNPEIGGDPFDPLLLRWCDEGDFTDWAPSVTNQAGSYHIPSGSRLVGGIWSPNFIAIWTDIDMWLMSYLGGGAEFELVWGFQKVAGSAGLLSARSVALFRNLVFYLSSNGMYVFDGNRISLIPCPVWDKFWKNLNRMQVDKVNMQVNSYFQEIAICFPSAAGNGTVDSRITYNIRENLWTYDDAPSLLPRTAWIDENVYGSPAGMDQNGYIQQQDSEGVYDADGAPLPSSIRTGWFSSGEGTLLQMMERLEADMICTGGSIQVTVFAKDYAIEDVAYPVRTYGPYSWTPGSGPPYFITRARGRFFSVMFSSTALGVFWRCGNTRMQLQPSGRRP